MTCAAGVAVFVVGCSSGATTTVSATTSTTTTTAPTIATTTTVVPAQPQVTPSDAATVFMQAWRDGDAQAAATVALAPAVQTAFAAGVPSSVRSTGCMTGGFDPTSCAFRTDLGEVQVRATQRGGGWVVDQVIISAL
jgi:hypothetical protein